MRAADLLVKLFLALALVCGGAAGARAAASDWATTEHGKLRLIAAPTKAGDGKLRLGLDFRMADGWKIYWRSPGDAGYAPRVSWAESANLTAARMHWPVPHRFQLFGLQTFGYKNRVVLPVTARAPDPAAPTRVRATVDYLTCADICVPHSAKLSLTLTPGAGTPGDHAHAIAKYRARVPDLGADSGLTLKRAALTGTGDKPRLALDVRARPPLDAPDAIVEGLPGVRFGPPEVTLEDRGRRAVLRLTGTRGDDAPATLAGKTVTVTVFDGNRGLEREVTLTPGSVDAAAPPGGAGAGGGGTNAATWAGMLGLAVLGGLILNLMPCVLPVLSLKVLSVIGQGGAARRRVRVGFLASAAGIVASFWVLAAGAAAVKAAGMAVGWGVQFQQPPFLVGMVVVVTLFAANLAGVFEIGPPAPIAGRADAATRRGGLTGHFLTGAFATLLATPCSAPFLGTAVAFALSRGPLEIAAIFTALGVGLALPYLAVAAMPAVATRMPRPGRWMLRVKQVLALALAATGVWLLTVLAAQKGAPAAVAVGAAMILLVLAIWGRRRARAPLRRAALPAMAMLVVAAFAVPQVVGTRAGATAASDRTAWRPLDRARIDTLVERGKVVFVDVTAEWCITCQVNKARVIGTDPVAGRLARERVIRMRGDWTARSDRIARYLADHGRYGIPFNAVYGPGAPEGIVLPELLTTDAVLNALERARRG